MSMAARSIRDLWERVARFSERDLWERDLQEFPRAQRWLVIVLRLGSVVRSGFDRHQLSTRAGALTYVTIFSLVPTLAVAFAMFDAFGGIENAKSILLPKILDYLAVGVRQQAESRISAMLENLHGGAIGATGFVFLIVAVVMLLSSMEDVFNDIWGVRRSRSYFERITIYWTVVTVTPTLLVVGLSLPSIVLRVAPLQWILEQTGTGHVFFSTLLPLVFICAAFALMYSFITCASVPFSAALIGGVSAGTLWMIAAGAYAWYARASVYYANVYGSLSAIPIFVFWIYLSWLIVLLGAQLAFASQNLSTYREEILSPEASHGARELLALRIMTEVSRRFLRGEEPAAPQYLHDVLHVSRRLTNEAVQHLIEIGLLVESGDGRRLIPSRDPKEIFPAQLLYRLREQGETPHWRRKDATTRELENLRQRAEEAAWRAWEDRSFGDLALSDGAVAPPDGGSVDSEDAETREPDAGKS
jgi:membrane protein